jgi:hypothetical protein
MSLDFQPLSIVFTGGLDTKADPKTVQITKLLELQNGVFTKPGIIARRFGHDILPRTIIGGTSSIAAAQSLAVFDDELLLFSGTRVYSYSPALSSWLDRGGVSACTTREVPILRNSASQANVDVAVNAGVRLVAWEDSRGGVRYSVQDTVSGAFFISDAIAKSTGARPKCIAFGTELVLFYTSSSGIHYRRIQTSTPTTVGAEVNPVATLAASATYDVLPTTGRIFIAWNDSGTVTARLSYLDSTFALAAPVSGVLNATNAIGLVLSPDAAVVVLLLATATDMKVRAYTYLLAAASPTTTIETVNGVQRCTGILTAGSTTLTVFYEIADPVTNTPGGSVRVNTLNTVTGAVGAPADLIRGVGLWAGAISYNGVTYLGVARQSAYQSVYLVVDSTGLVIAKVAPEVGGGLRTCPTVGTFSMISSGLYELGYVELGRYVTTRARPATRCPARR